MRFILLRYFLTLIIATALTYKLIPIMQKVAKQWGIVDTPDGKLKKHTQPTPYLGGLVIYLPFITTLALIYPFGNNILWIILGVTMLLFVGLIDDVVEFSPLQKLAGQSLAVICFLKSGLSLKDEFFSVVFTIPLTGLWMLTVINAFNLVDVADGLASVLALGSASSFLAFALWQGNYELGLLLFAFICPLAVFFFGANMPKASMYLGDAGALWIGGFLSAMPLMFSWREVAAYGFVAPLLILAFPVLEVVLLIVQRLWFGIPFWQGSPHHLAIHLQRRGYSAWGVVLLASGTSVLLSMGTLGYITGLLPVYVLQVLFLCFSVFWIRIIF